MKKSITRISAVLATALMVASTTGMTISSGSIKGADAVRGGKTTKSASRSTRSTRGSRRAKGGSARTSIEETGAEETIALQGKNAQQGDGIKAKPGEIIEIDLVMDSNNLCTCFDITLEYDNRLEFVGVDGATFCPYEEDGKQLVSLVGFRDHAYEDGETAATLKLMVPEDAENDDYYVRFNTITNFSTNDYDFENFAQKDTFITVTDGKEKQGARLSLSSVRSMAGENAVVSFTTKTNNTCNNFDIVLEYDSRLSIEDSDIIGPSHSVYVDSETGASCISLVGFTGGTFSDNQMLAALNFTVPEDATEDDVYEVTVSKINNFGDAKGDYEKIVTETATISIASDSNANVKHSEYKYYKKYDANGNLIFATAGKRGDANNDDQLTIRDASAIAKFCADKHSAVKNIDENGQFFGDVNDDGKLDVRDATKIAQYFATRASSWDDVLK